LFLADKPQDIGEVPDGAAAHMNDGQELKVCIEPVTIKKLFKDNSFYYICLNYCAKSFLYYSVISYMVIFLVSSGISSGYAAKAISLLSLMSLVGRIICGFIRESFIKPNMLITFCNIAMAAGMLVVLTLPGIELIFIASGVMGFGLGIGQVAMPLTISRFFGASNFAKTNGIIWPGNYICGAVGPVLIGLMADSFESYAPPFLIVSVIAIICGLPIAFKKLPVFTKAMRDDCGNAPKFEADVK
jgi:cyanate permease